MRKLLAIITIILFISGCTYNKDFTIDSTTNYNLTVPKDMDISFQLSWYRISATDYISTIDYNKNESPNAIYTIGDNVFLSGINVEQLNGANISIRQYNLKDGIDDSYYETLLLEENYTYDLNKYNLSNNEFIGPSEKEIRKTESILKPYIDKSKVIVCNLSYFGKIHEQVTIEKIKIDSLNYEFDFDAFRITTADLPKDQFLEINKIFTPSSYGGILVGPSLSEVGFSFIEGTAECNIKEIMSTSINNVCKVINKDNYDEYKKYEIENDISLYREQKRTNFNEGDKINIEFSYKYEDIETEEFRKYDSVVASIANIFILDDGTELYNYMYQTSMRAAEYGLVHLLHDLR